MIKPKQESYRTAAEPDDDTHPVSEGFQTGIFGKQLATWNSMAQ
ncbi:hypothetical protein ACFSMW_01145 [Virgibacillus halophilus]